MTDYNNEYDNDCLEDLEIDPSEILDYSISEKFLAYAGRKKLPSGAPSTNKPGSCTASLSPVLISGKTLTSTSSITAATKTRSTRPSLLAAEKKGLACFSKE